MKKLILIVLVISLFSCRSKKNVVDVQKSDIKTELNTDIETNEKKDTSIDSTATSKEITITTNTNEIIEAESVTDSSQIDVTKTVKGNQINWQIKGAKNIKISSGKKDTTTEKEDSASLTKKDKSKTDKSETNSIDIDESKKEKHSDREASGISPFVGIGIGVSVVAGGVILYYNLPWLIALFRRKRKS
jgi:hypothetical protein